MPERQDWIIKCANYLILQEAQDIFRFWVDTCVISEKSAVKFITLSDYDIKIVQLFWLVTNWNYWYI